MRERRQGETMKIIRMVLLITNGIYLLTSVVGVVALLRAGVELPLPRTVGVFGFSFLLAGNVAYIWWYPPRTKHPSDRQLIDTF
jgi:hypothetical protein